MIRVTVLLVLYVYFVCSLSVYCVSLILLHVDNVNTTGCKVLNYTSRAPGRKWIKDYLVDPGFGVFTIVFFITRLVLYPRYILYSVIIDGYKVLLAL